jgi:hypothetical protein
MPAAVNRHAGETSPVGAGAGNELEITSRGFRVLRGEGRGLLCEWNDDGKLKKKD